MTAAPSPITIQHRYPAKRGIQMRFSSVLGRTLATAGLVVGMGAAGMAAASASPSKAPTSLTGSFFDCTNGASGTFVVNSGKAAPPTTAWDSAHLMFKGGGTGIFVSTELHLTSPFGPEDFTKGNAPSSVTCSISADLGGGAMLTGTVVGNIIHNG
jgi:hypothetical protein